jgi:signal transduction histidine kinase
MNGTNHSNGGLRRITWLAPVVNVRLVVFALAVGLGVLLVLWLQAGVGRQMAHLEQEFSTLKAEAFYVGVQTRVQVRRLNDTLLASQLDQNPADLESFKKQAAELKYWFTNKEVSLSTGKERELFGQLETACDRYLAEAEQLLQAGDPRTERATFAATYERIERFSKPLLDTVGRFVEVQQEAFNAFLQASQDTLLSLRRLLNLSLGLLLAAGAVLAVLLYRGMITPLRRRLTESQSIIARQEKLASLGTLAAGVAHEIRNPLTAIKFRLFSFQKALPREFADHEDAVIISSEINRLDRIVREFLQFARPAEPVLARVPAQRLLQEVIDLLTPELQKAGIVLKLEPSEVLWLHADTQQIKQVLINLVQNAADSIGRTGAISLRATPDTTMLAGRSSSVVILSVTDTGKGIPPEVENRLFDPFFSSKENGTGLGLAIAARIVEKHGGLLRYQTRLNRGTTFETVLPRIEDHATQPPDH